MTCLATNPYLWKMRNNEPLCLIGRSAVYKYMAMLHVMTRPAMVAKVFYLNDVAEGYFLLYQKDRLVRAARIYVLQDHVFNELDVAFVHSLSFGLTCVPYFHSHNFCHVVVCSDSLSFLISEDVKNFCANSSAIYRFHRGNA